MNRRLLYDVSRRYQAPRSKKTRPKLGNVPGEEGAPESSFLVYSHGLQLYKFITWGIISRNSFSANRARIFPIQYAWENHMCPVFRCNVFSRVSETL